MTVIRLKSLLSDALELLQGYDDDQKVKMVSNTYFLKGAYCFLGITGYDGGYIDLDNPIADDDDD